RSMDRPQASPTRIPDPMERDRERHLIVIGGGPGGMAAARAAARAGVRPLLVQMGPIGGDCTFTGCVPSKTLIEAAARGERFTEAIAATHRAVEAIAAQEDDDVVRGEGIDVLHGWATFRSPREVELDGTVLRSERVVIATGAGPAVPPIPGLADIDYLTNESIFELDQQPATLAVLGGGAVGCELAQASRRPRSEVTVGEALGGGFVKVNAYLATSRPGIWAAGDVTGLLPFTHAADEMGRVAVANALSRRPRRRFDPSPIPWVTFTSPEVARVGMTEA